MADKWIDYASSTVRGDKELLAMIDGVLKVSGAAKVSAAGGKSCGFGLLAHNEAEKARMLALMAGKHGAKLIEVSTAAELQAAQEKAVG